MARLVSASAWLRRVALYRGVGKLVHVQLWVRAVVGVEPLDFPQHRDWVMQYRQWWAQGIEGWARRQRADATLNFLVELGPPAYAITGPDQRELSDRWLEGLQIREWVEAIWSVAASVTD